MLQRCVLAYVCLAAVKLCKYVAIWSSEWQTVQTFDIHLYIYSDRYLLGLKHLFTRYQMENTYFVVAVFVRIKDSESTNVTNTHSHTHIYMYYYIAKLHMVSLLCVCARVSVWVWARDSRTEPYVYIWFGTIKERHKRVGWILAGRKRETERE